MRKLLKILAAWRPFSFLDRFVPAPRSLFGWSEKKVDMVNQVGTTKGLNRGSMEKAKATVKIKEFLSKWE